VTNIFTMLASLAKKLDDSVLAPLMLYTKQPS
jgi:hypothetical protein